jgi:hypothetical protein
MMKLFCCCLPVRIGVFVLAPITFVIAAFLAYVGWTSFHLYMATVSMLQNVITVLFALSSTLLCVFSVAGFIGTLMASLPLVSAYSRMLFGQWIIDLGVNVGYLVLWFTFAKNNVVNQCIAGTGTFLSNLQGNITQGLSNATAGLANSTAPLAGDAIGNITNGIAGNLNQTTSDIFNVQEREKLCNAGFEVLKIVFIVIFVVYKLISLYGCIITYRYVEQLRSEQTEQRWHDVERKVGHIQAVQQAQIQQTQYPFTTPQNQVAGGGGGGYAGYRA